MSVHRHHKPRVGKDIQALYVAMQLWDLHNIFSSPQRGLNELIMSSNFQRPRILISFKWWDLKASFEGIRCHHPPPPAPHSNMAGEAQFQGYNCRQVNNHNNSIWYSSGSKVDVCYSDTFLSLSAPTRTHFSWNMKYGISGRWLANPNCVRSHLPYDFWSSYEYFIHYHNEDSRAH